MSVRIGELEYIIKKYSNKKNMNSHFSLISLFGNYANIHIKFFIYILKKKRRKNFLHHV